MPKLNSKLCSK